MTPEIEIRPGDRFVEKDDVAPPRRTRIFVVERVLGVHILWVGMPASNLAPIDLVLKHMRRLP
jgi:hypothetical protein